jgi:hypothetical protein
MKDTYLHESLDDCCTSFFDAWDKECVVVDICTSSAPSAKPTFKPATSAAQSTTTTSATAQVTEEESCARPFHPTTDFKSCTNRLVTVSRYPVLSRMNYDSQNFFISTSNEVWTTPSHGHCHKCETNICLKVELLVASNFSGYKERIVQRVTSV